MDPTKKPYSATFKTFLKLRVKRKNKQTQKQLGTWLTRTSTFTLSQVLHNSTVDDNNYDNNDDSNDDDDDISDFDRDEQDVIIRATLIIIIVKCRNIQFKHTKNIYRL